MLMVTILLMVTIYRDFDVVLTFTTRLPKRQAIARVRASSVPKVDVNFCAFLEPKWSPELPGVQMESTSLACNSFDISRAYI